MSAVPASVGTRHVKPVKRPRGPQVLTFLFTFLQPAIFGLAGSLKESPMRAATRKHPYVPGASKASQSTPLPIPPTPVPEKFDNIFIDALVQACSCRQHARPRKTNYSISNAEHLYHKARRRRLQNTGMQTRSFHRVTNPPRPPAIKPPISQEDYIGMVDYYREPYCTIASLKSVEPPPERPDSVEFEPIELQQVPSTDPGSRNFQPIPIPPAHPSGSSDPVLNAGVARPEDRTVTQQASIFSPLEELTPQQLPESIVANKHDETRPEVVEVMSVLEKSRCTHHEAFVAYATLPSPGVACLSPHSQRLLFRRLSTIERKDRESMLRYLSVVDDMKSLNLPLTEAEWNSAISFCGRCFVRISVAAVEEALLIWKEMEQQARVKAGHVTFNILFDLAAKAGKFVLAEMIHKEMEARNLPMNRYGRVGFIYYNGLRGDGDGVRRAYREFVEAGEIVDTVVMNCVIASLLRAGEPGAADQVYERMKKMLSKHTGKAHPALDWLERRDLGRVLDAAARRFRTQPEKTERLHDEKFIAPDLHTYSIFVEYHVSETGELQRIIALLSEMHVHGVPLHGRIFLKLFKGFAYHGGIRYTAWTGGRLESVWASLLQVLDQGAEGVMVTKWLVLWVVHAFDKCCGRGRLLDVWDELRRRWEPGGGELEDVYRRLRDIL